jgi:nucleotide-binding universal stress UspA family protein
MLASAAIKGVGIISEREIVSLRQMLVATDFSAISVTALRHALGIAKRYRSAVSLVHIIDGSFYGMVGPDAIAAEMDAALRDGEQLMKRLEEQGLLDGLQRSFSVKVGSVWPTLADAMEETQSDLLVLGTHGHSGLRKLVLGSVAESAFRQARCPVMTVGPKALCTKSSGLEARNFLVPTDLSHASLKPLAYGVSLAQSTSGCVSLLHVLDGNSGNLAKRDLLMEVQRQLDTFVKEHAEAANIIDCLVGLGSPAEVILKTAEASQSDLIVMGLNAWSADGPPMWRTAYEVVTQAPCPVLSLKTPAQMSKRAAA